ncbi:MAG: AEC family transporter [Clostridia bacterium]|nr:AEC family transporter [Clostridia bacterium]
MSSLIFAVNAVLPIVIITVIGYICKQTGLISTSGAKMLNKVLFRVLLPCMLFLNVYKIESLVSINFDYIWFSLVMTLLFFLVGIPLCMLITKRADQRGALLQAIFRSNYALIGIPLAASLYGEEGSIIATVLSAFCIPLFNILAVICLTMFGKNGKISIKKIIMGIIKNPLILSIALGGVCLAVRGFFESKGVAFRLSDIKPIYSAVEQMAKTATPISLLALGAEFEFAAIPKLKKQIIFGTTMRVIIVPAIAFFIAYLTKNFGGAHFAAFIAMFASPVAVSSVPMAQEMQADSELAGQLVIWSTIASAFTIFLFSFILKLLGCFA